MPIIGPWFEGRTGKEAIEQAERYRAACADQEVYNIGVGRELEERLVGDDLEQLLTEVVGLVRGRRSACLRCTYRRGQPGSFPFYAVRRPDTMLLEIGTRADMEGSGLAVIMDHFDGRRPS